MQLPTPGRNDPSTTAALSVVMALTPEFKSQVAVLSARTEFDVEAALIDRKKVIWGEPTDNAKKMQMLRRCWPRATAPSTTSPTRRWPPSAGPATPGAPSGAARPAPTCPKRTAGAPAAVR